MRWSGGGGGEGAVMGGEGGGRRGGGFKREIRGTAIKHSSIYRRKRPTRCTLFFKIKTTIVTHVRTVCTLLGIFTSILQRKGTAS
jgi:hypothetical protein